MRTIGRVLLVGSALGVCVAAPHALAAQDPDFRVTLLGTGTPQPSMVRFGPSILVEAGPTKLVFDAGRGAMQRLTQVGVRFDQVSGVFLTHLHSDHVVGLPDLWLTGWLNARRTDPVRLWGPAGTRHLASHLQTAFDFDVRIRIADDNAPAGGGRFEAREVSDGMVIELGDVRVTAFLVDHPPIRPAFGYRVDYRGHSVVLSGDTKPSDNLVSHAQGVDLLIHEVAIATDTNLASSSLTRSIMAHHTTAAEAADVFNRTHPKLAVFSHIVVRPGATDRDLVPLTRATYAGPLVLGQDLMQFTVGDSVTVRSAGTAGQVAPIPDAQVPQRRELLRTGRFTVFLLDLPPGQATPMHRHDLDIVAVFPSGARSISTFWQESPRPDHMPVGAVRFRAAGFTHATADADTSHFLSVIVEFTRSQGLPDSSTAGNTTLFCLRDACVLDVTVQPGATWQSPAPALMIPVTSSAWNTPERTLAIGTAVYEPASGAPWRNMGASPARVIALSMRP